MSAINPHGMTYKHREMESVSKKIFLKIAIKMKLIGEKKGDEMT